jgi:hypothetical protein
MSTTLHTRRLIEHRYGRALEYLQRDVAHSRSADPVLPIVLRRLAGLTEISEQTSAARRALAEVVHKGRSGEQGPGDLLRHYVAEVVDLERPEQSEAEAVWDLLDVRLLLDQPTAGRTASRRTAPASQDAELLQAAREVAVFLPRLNREVLRRALRERGIHVSNRRLGTVLQQLRAERTEC